MANIKGTYVLEPASNGISLDIGPINSSGAFQGVLQSQTNSTPIHGSYDASTNQLSFNDAWSPGQVLFVTFYTGHAILGANAEGGVQGLAGTWQLLTLGFKSFPVVLKPEFVNGVWFADLHTGEIH